MIFRTLILFSTVILFTGLTAPDNAAAQDRFGISVFPGYHAINTDTISDNENVSQTDWIFGLNLTTRFRISDVPLAYTVGAAYGSSTILDQTYGFNLEFNRTIDLRYRSLPQELLWVYSVTENIELLTGINVTLQDRTLRYSYSDIEDDRLFSVGLGLSGKVHLVLSRFSSGNGRLFMNLAARWTEFIWHDEQGRDLDDFTLRHVTFSPEIGVSWGL